MAGVNKSIESVFGLKMMGLVDVKVKGFSELEMAWEHLKLKWGISRERSAAPGHR